MNYQQQREVEQAIIDEDFHVLAQHLMRTECLDLMECEICDEIRHNDDFQHMEDTDRYLCDGCASSAHYRESDGLYYEECPPSDDLASYHSGRRVDPEPGQVGIEVELQFRDDLCEVAEVAQANGLLAEEDSSLTEPDSGEIITQPFSPDKAGIRAMGGLAEFLDKIRAIGWSLPNYAIHVSHNRRGTISRYDCARLERFFGNSQADLCRVAGRESEQYAPFSYQAHYRRDTRHQGTETGKYRALHITADRVEFRIFQANARAQGVRDMLRLSLDLVTYCRRAGYRGLTWPQFCQAFPVWRNYRQAEEIASQEK